MIKKQRTPEQLAKLAASRARALAAQKARFACRKATEDREKRIADHQHNLFLCVMKTLSTAKLCDLTRKERKQTRKGDII